MPVTTKRSRKVVPIKVRGLTGRNGAIDFAANAQMFNHEIGNPDEHIYRVIELVGTSEDSIEDAITSAVARAPHAAASALVRRERTSGNIANGAVLHYQVTPKVGFTMETASV